MSKSIDSVDAELDFLRNRVDAMEEDAKGGAWHKKPSNILAVLAFVVSVGTTVFSLQHTEQQDVHGLRAELRSIMQRLLALPRDNAEQREKYKSDVNMQSTIKIT